MVSKLELLLKDNLQCVLHYGTSVYNNDFNDVDLMVILKNKETVAEMDAIHNLCKDLQFNGLDIQLINISEINPKIFSHDVHGEFFFLFSKELKVLQGKNPFIGKEVEYDRQIVSVIQKAQYYYYNFKKSYLHKNNFSKEDMEMTRKRILLILCDFYLVYTGKVLWYKSSNFTQKIPDLIDIFFEEERPNLELSFLNSETDLLNKNQLFNIMSEYYNNLKDRLLCSIDKEIKIKYVNSIYTETHDIKSDKAICIVSGCPTSYDEKIIQYLNIRGYNVILFHYSSTGKSKDVGFIDPTNDLTEVINTFSKNYNKFNLLTNSFGGYASFNLSKSTLEKVDHVLCISPAISLKDVRSIDTLADFLSTKMSYQYRFDTEEFNDYLLNSGIPEISNTSKYTIVHGELDDQINPNSVRDFADSNNITYNIIPDYGHMSLNSVLNKNIHIISNHI